MFNRKNRWQIVSDDSVWMFPADVTLSTVELPRIKLNEDQELYDEHFESCLFFANGDSDVICRYETQEQAVEGHIELEKKYGLKRTNKLNLSKG